MGGPPGGLKASVEHMRITADNWSHGAARLEGAAADAEAMETTKLEMGIFRMVWSEYDSAVKYIQDRLTEGSTEFENVARALHSCAAAYDIAEADFASSLKQLQVGDGR